MAIFGEGLGADPVASAERKAALRRETERLATVRDLGQGKSGIVKGGIALGERAGNILGRGIAGAFGVEQPVAPEVAEAQEQVALLEKFNAVEGDKASAEYARNLAKTALGAGRQDLAFQFGQVAAERGQAETMLAAKAEQARVDNFRKSLTAAPRVTQLGVVANGSEDVFASLNVTDADSRASLQADARAEIESTLLKNAADAAKVQAAFDTSVSKADVDQATQALEAAGVTANFGWSSGGDEKTEKTNTAVASMVAAGVNAEASRMRREGKAINRATLAQQVIDGLISNGTLSVEVAEGGFLNEIAGGASEGTRVITGINTTPVPNDEVAPATPGQRRGVTLN